MLNATYDMTAATVMDELDTASKELERVCGELGVHPVDILVHKMKNDDFTGLGINKDDNVIFDCNLQPIKQRLTMLKYDGEMEPVLLLGYDFMQHPIIAQTFITCPDAISFEFHIDLIYGAIAIIWNRLLIKL